MRKFSELELTEEQEEFVDKHMYPWGAWIRLGRLDKPGLNIIAKLMKSVIPAESSEPVSVSYTHLTLPTKRIV